jgi:serine/threonine-protein kinase
MPLTDGEVFAGYTILRVLGTGGMGEVYLAEHPRLPRRDALKVLGTAVSHDDEYRQRFNQEAEMVATLRHPSIVTIYDRGDFEDQLWISMEFIDGTDAFRLLTERHPRGIPAAQVVQIVGAVADALDYAHSRHLLHRDIKPANILLGHPESGDHIDRILLADFGVARWVGQTSYLTGTDTTVGTVTYAAPEQLKGEEIDGHADQYSLAATAFHLLTGAAPFSNTNPAAVISAHLSAPPPDIGTGHPDLSRFEPVFAKALAKTPADRFDRCGDFARAMQDALVSSGGAPRHRKAGPAPAPGRSRWITAGLGGLLLAGAVGVAAVLASQHRSSESRTAPTTPPPPAVSARMDLPVVVIGADCAVLGAAAVTENGSPAYCARADSQSAATVWSMQPERLRTTTPSPP